MIFITYRLRVNIVHQRCKLNIFWKTLEALSILKFSYYSVIILLQCSVPGGVSGREKNSISPFLSCMSDEVLMSPLLGTGLPYGLHIRRNEHNPPRGPSAGC
jgi:hypothetical protein